MEKTTLRLPAALLDELRERSQQQGKSLNSTVVDTLWRGLGKPPTKGQAAEILGSMIVEPATATYSRKVLETSWRNLPDEARHLSDALDWTREA